MNAEEQEDLTNELCDSIWPALDKGATRDEVMAIIYNVLDAYTPKKEETHG